MPVITSVKQQKNEKRVNIFLDGKFTFGIDLENFIKFKLKEGKELTDEEVSIIIKKSEFQKTLDKLLNFVMTRPRSEKEVRDYLKRKKVPETLNGDLFERLKYFELLDDIKFAKWWVEQRTTFKKKTKKIIEQELKVKGIKADIIKNVLGEVEIDELYLAKELVNKKMYKWQKFDERTKKQKISSFLQGKGFDWNIINEVLKLDDYVVE